VPPPGMTQQQLDSLIDAISNRVVEKLKHEGAPAVKPAEPTRGAADDDTDVEDVASAQAVAFIARAKLVLGAYPEFWRSLARIPVLLDASASGGRGTVLFLIMLAGAIAVALGSEAVLRRSLDGLRRRLAAVVVEAKRFWPLLGLAVLDALGLACVLIVSYGVIGHWFPGSDAQSRLAAGILAGVFYWRLYMVVFRIFFRPGLPDARLVRLDDSDARAVYFRLSTVIASITAIRIFIRILIAMKASPDAIAAGRVLSAFLLPGVLLWASWRSRQALATWFTGMGGPTAAAGMQGVVAKH
jgi:moderate conductance mechanosensitive channel